VSDSRAIHFQKPTGNKGRGLLDNRSVTIIISTEKTSHVDFFLWLGLFLNNLSSGSSRGGSGGTTSGSGSREGGESSGDELMELFAFEGSADLGNLTFIGRGTSLLELVTAGLASLSAAGPAGGATATASAGAAAKVVEEEPEPEEEVDMGGLFGGDDDGY
jgi:hypothetical protein